MAKNEREAFNLLREWIANDHPVYHFSEEGVRLNRKHKTDYGEGLRDFILGIRSSAVVPPTFPGDVLINRAYSSLCWELGSRPDYPNGYPADAGFALWTMEQISDLEFSQIDWAALADDLFGELHGIK